MGQLLLASQTLARIAELVSQLYSNHHFDTSVTQTEGGFIAECSVFKDISKVVLEIGT